MNDAATIRRLIESPEIAVIGLSSDPGRPSHYVSAYMQSCGAHIVPVNPACDGTILGERCLPSLDQLLTPPALVNVFRLPRFIPAIVDQMIRLGLSALWIQSGIAVVMDRCLMVEHRAAHARR